MLSTPLAAAAAALLLQLLTGACEALGSLLNLEMSWQQAPSITTWCQHNYVIEVANNIPKLTAQHKSYTTTTNSSSSSDKKCYLGDVTVLFDEGYDGMPYTTLIRYASPCTLQCSDSQPAQSSRLASQMQTMGVCQTAESAPAYNTLCDPGRIQGLIIKPRSGLLFPASVLFIAN